MQRGVDAHVPEAPVPVEPLVHGAAPTGGRPPGSAGIRTIAPPSPFTAVAMSMRPPGQSSVPLSPGCPPPRA
jgi:hypothetical protein